MKYFDIEEFDSPDVPGSGENMNQQFLLKLDRARSVADVPFMINSGYRTVSHNADINGSPTSSHMGGWASDIHCNRGIRRKQIIKALLEVGFTRIGIAKTFIHVDNDPHKNDSIWLY